MCEIVYCPRGKNISKQHLIESFKQNNHGYGVVAVGEEKISYGFNEKSLLKDWFSLPIDKPRILHTRYANRGAKTVNNLHPFNVSLGDQYRLLFHNGTVSLPTIQGMSDTHALAMLINSLKLNSDTCLKELCSLSGSTGSRFLLQDGEKVWFCGDWLFDDEGRYYSNGNTLGALGKLWVRGMFSMAFQHGFSFVKQGLYEANPDYKPPAVSAYKPPTKHYSQKEFDQQWENVKRWNESAFYTGEETI